jgi:type I restriction enzyme S subunit
MIVEPTAFEERELSDLVSIEIGRTPSRSNPAYWGGIQPWVTISDFEHGDIVNETKESITQQALNECGVRVHDAGTLIMSFKLTIGKLAILGAPMATNEAIAALKPIHPDTIDERFLFHYLSQCNFDNLVDRAAKGKTLNKAKLSRIPIKFPRDLAEQRRIVKILDKAVGVRGKSERLVSLADDLLRSAFLHIVGFKNPQHESWKRYSIEDLAAPQKGAMRTGPFGSDLRHSEFVDSGIAVLGIDNAVKNQFGWDERRYITEEKFRDLRRYQVYPGDIIVTIMGTTGRSAVVPDDIPTAITTKHLATITCNRRLVEPDFLSFAIHSDPLLIGQIKQANKGAIMDGLNLGIIKSLQIHLPPMELQKQFSQLLRTVSKLKREAETGDGSGTSLFQSLSQRAFRGEL